MRIVVDNGVRMGRGRAQGGVEGIRQREQDGFVELVQGIIDNVNGDVLADHPGREGQGAAGQRVVHAPAGGRAARHRVIDGYRLARGDGERHRHVGRCDRLDASRRRQAEGDSGRAVIVHDGTGAGAIGDCRMDRVAQVDGEGLVIFVVVIPGDQHGNRLGGGRAGWKSQRAALGHIVAPGGGRAVGSGVVHCDVLRTGSGDGHCEFGAAG